MYRLLDEMVEEIGESNVIQVVTDNASNYVVAGRLLEAKRPHLYWTPCAAHCIDLILEDIGKMPSIHATLKRAIFLNGYIYNRVGVVNLMRQFTGGKELLRPAVTRFATAFITHRSIHLQKNNLRKMFISEDWNTTKWAKEAAGKRAATIVLMPTFWSTIVYALKLTGSAQLPSQMMLSEGMTRRPLVHSKPGLIRRIFLSFFCEAGLALHAGALCSSSFRIARRQFDYNSPQFRLDGKLHHGPRERCLMQ
ncbi:uncharacterized protein LOC131167450 [Malania oleifera]|uniref:uncharacterized protein LOC131167450 n=1 Tax=Malania oleifera TaxID=397392 RepID=UPI0025ADFEE7|nr:uncharacterized protein LOC131167450 [Malania oleifera]